VRRAGKEIAAAVGALAAYQFTVMPAVRRELRRWAPLPEAKAKNAEAVSVFATLAPRSTRATAVRAIVALQIAIDHLDVLEEARGAGAGKSESEDRLERLDATWREQVASLPAGGTALPSIERAIERCLQGQRHTHAAAAGEVDGLRSWAQELRAPAGYRWWELAAGASSSVAAHALIAAAAETETCESTVAAIEAAYFPPIGALTVLLDDLVDRDRDLAAGEHNYLNYYDDPAEAAERLGLVAERAAILVAPLPQAECHRAILAGVAAFYLSAPEAGHPDAQQARARLMTALGPGARLLAAFVQLRRLARRKRPGQPG